VRFAELFCCSTGTGGIFGPLSAATSAGIVVSTLAAGVIHLPQQYQMSVTATMIKGVVETNSNESAKLVMLIDSDHVAKWIASTAPVAIRSGSWPRHRIRITGEAARQFATNPGI
jgi:glucan phosphoethanolaminetransferase (alkaline phosphatase superfamily)